MNEVTTAARLEAAFRRRFGGSPYAPGREDYYGIEVRDLSPDGTAFDLHVTFKRDERYCCMEAGCHFGLWTAEHWQETRAELAHVGLAGLPPLTVRKLCVHVQEGARFGLRFPGDARDLPPHEAESYELGPLHEATPETTPTS